MTERIADIFGWLNPQLLTALLAALPLVCGCEGAGSDGPDQDYNGTWTGSTSGGGELRFVVSGDKVVNLYLRHGGNTLTQNEGNSADISGNSFAIDHKTVLETGQISGTFETATQCSGTYFFNGNPLSGPVSFSGTFTATKQ